VKAVPGTPSWLRETNDRTALSLLLEHGTLTRNRLGELSGLSKPTASQMIVRLETLGLIHAVGEVSAGRGPSASSYAVRHDRVLGVAININHQLVQSTVVDVLGTEYPVVESALPKSARERDAVTDVTGAIREACAASGMPTSAVRMACVAVQGAVDPRNDELSFVEALPGWPRKGVRATLENALGHAVFIDNDVNLAAVAERRHGSGADADSFALLWLGEGLGLAVDLGGSVHRGASGRAGEIGYLKVPAAASGLDPEAKDLQDLVGASGLAGVGRAHGLRKRNYQALIAALPTHPHRDQIFTELAPRVAAGVTAVLAVLDPGRIVLGGPTSAVGGRKLAEAVQTFIRHDSRWSPEIVTSTVPDHPVLRGAHDLLVTEVREMLIGHVNVVAAPSAPSHPIRTASFTNSEVHQ